jgi:hypothetical protein
MTIHQFWRFSEPGPDNLGLACTDDGLLLGQTPLIERRDGRFVVRQPNEIERLLKRAYHGEPAVDRLMPGLATVASALNANDPCLARIAAVHLKIPDLPSSAARDALEAEDSLIKYARDEGSGTDWNPALHPRAGTPPNPGWFAPTDGETDDTSRVRIADLHAATYQDATRLTYRLKNYVNDLSEFIGRNWANDEVRFSDIKGRALSLAIPKGSMTAVQRDAIEAVRTWARMKNHNPVEIFIKEF